MSILTKDGVRIDDRVTGRLVAYHVYCSEGHWLDTIIPARALLDIVPVDCPNCDSSFHHVARVVAFDKEKIPIRVERNELREITQ
jgi:hypothetical protein